MDIRSLLVQWEKEEYGNIRFLRAKSGNYAIYRYLCTSRAGIIHIHFQKENNILYVTIKEYILGFFLPFTLVLFGLGMMYVGRLYSSLILLFLGIFFLLFLYVHFKLFAKRIKEKILIPLTTK